MQIWAITTLTSTSTEETQADQRCKFFLPSVEDKWIEFNDSRIANFKLSDLEEECFGSKEDTTFTRFDDDYESFFPSKGGKFSIDKCAYILVYEKVQKKPITIIFTKDNMCEKEMILKNIKEEKQESLVIETKDNGEEHIQIGFYDLKSYVPPKLQNQIKQDNFKFAIEQHVYSKEFLNFICSLSEFKELGDFNPYALKSKIYTHVTDPEVISMMSTCLDANLLFLMDVFTKTEDNQAICKFSDNLNRMVSICHEKAIHILRRSIWPNIKQIAHILLECPDSNVRTAISDMVGHTILVAIASGRIVIHDSDSKGSSESLGENSDEDLIKNILKKLLVLFKKDKKDTTYKKLKGFFRMWLYLVKNSSEILLWLVKENKFIERLISNHSLIRFLQ